MSSIIFSRLKVQHCLSWVSPIKCYHLQVNIIWLDGPFKEWSNFILHFSVIVENFSVWFCYQVHYSCTIALACKTNTDPSYIVYKMYAAARVVWEENSFQGEKYFLNESARCFWSVSLSKNKEQRNFPMYMVQIYYKLKVQSHQILDSILVFRKLNQYFL
jgi:hypothetical protein